MKTVSDSRTKAAMAASEGVRLEPVNGCPHSIYPRLLSDWLGVTQQLEPNSARCMNPFRF